MNLNLTTTVINYTFFSQGGSFIDHFLFELISGTSGWNIETPNIFTHLIVLQLRGYNLNGITVKLIKLL